MKRNGFRDVFGAAAASAEELRAFGLVPFFFRSAHNSRRLFEHGVTVEVRRPDRLRSAPTSNGRGAAHLATRRPDRPVRRRNNGRAIVSFFFCVPFGFPLVHLNTKATRRCRMPTDEKCSRTVFPVFSNIRRRRPARLINYGRYN